jgi:hypothetical protein
MIIKDFNNPNNNYFLKNDMIKKEQKFVIPYDLLLIWLRTKY